MRASLPWKVSLAQRCDEWLLDDEWLLLPLEWLLLDDECDDDEWLLLLEDDVEVDGA